MQQMQHSPPIATIQMKRNNSISTVDKSKEFWCHLCRIKFYSFLKPGIDDVFCIKCNNDFCQLNDSNHSPERFIPYQKQPIKKSKHMKKIEKRANRITINELAQILQIEESQNFKVTEEMLKQIRKGCPHDSECSVCREDILEGQESIIPDCLHTFHQECLVQWIERKNTCPTCRQKIFKQEEGDP